MKRVCMVPANMSMGGPASFQRKLGARVEVHNIKTTYDSDNEPFDTVLIIYGTLSNICARRTLELFDN